MIRQRLFRAVFTLSLGCAALALAAPFVYGQQPGQQPAAQQAAKRLARQAPIGATSGKENPFAGAEDQKLLALAGAWQEDVRYAGDPDDSPSGKGRWIARPMFGLYLILNYEGSGPEGDYHAHGVMAYDHEDRAYRLWWFDDAGGIGEYTGAWKDDNTLVFEHKKNSGGRPFRERITYRKISNDELDTRVEQAWGTNPYKFYMEATAKRAQLQEGKGWGEKLSQQTRRSRLNPPPEQEKPPL